MIFAEQKKGNEWYYFLDDVIGEVELWSPNQLNHRKLDQVIITITSLKGTEGKIGDIKYKYKKAKVWQ